MADDAPKPTPPPVPSRTQRLSLKMETPIVAAPTDDAPADTQEYPPEEEEIPTDVANGEPLLEQNVAPNRYRWYKGRRNWKIIIL